MKGQTVQLNGNKNQEKIAKKKNERVKCYWFVGQVAYNCYHNGIYLGVSGLFFNEINGGRKMHSQDIYLL